MVSPEEYPLIFAGDKGGGQAHKGPSKNARPVAKEESRPKRFSEMSEPEQLRYLRGVLAARSLYEVEQDMLIKLQTRLGAFKTAP